MPRVDAIVVGAGLAGLAAALRLREAGREVVVLEASDAPGGRMRSDLVDGFTVDRGFQVLNTAYPELRRLDALRGVPTAGFLSGALLRSGDRMLPVGDPRRLPSADERLERLRGSISKRASTSAPEKAAECKSEDSRYPDVLYSCQLQHIFRRVSDSPSGFACAV